MRQTVKAAPLLIITLSCSLLLSLWTYMTPPPIKVNQGRVPSPLDWDVQKLLDLHSFKYLITSDVCRTGNISLVALVTSHASHFALRRAHRKDFGNRLWDLQVRRVFLLARTGRNESREYPAVSEEDIRKESKRYGDIVQGNFEEDYRNLTYKHVMGLKWVTTYCPQATYVLKMDDDIAIDMYQLLEMLQQYSNRHQLLLGYIHNGLNPRRDHSSKWYVTHGEFQAVTYPDFLSGWAYITTPDTAMLLLNQTVPYFWIDDVYVTGLLRRAAGLPLERWNYAFVSNPDHLRCCLKRPQYWCDYVIGPSGGDADLLRRFQAHSRQCHKLGCRRRKTGSEMGRICVHVNEPEMPVKSGKAMIKAINIL